MSDIRITIGPNGEVSFINNTELAGLLNEGQSAIKRVSHVEPLPRGRRLAFRLIRRLVTDESRAAAWTRNWRCAWIADLAPVNGPVLTGPNGKGFADRQAAIDAEVAWLNENLFRL